ncbi:MAG: HIT family protein [Acidimicrobiia bacterium]
MSCVFCAIVAGESPASVVDEDEAVVAFMDILPVTAGHTLVIPRRHALGLADLEDREGGAMFAVARRVAAALRRSGFRCEGINLFVADGLAAGQEVFHVHLHVLPRFPGDGFGLRIDRPGPPDRATLDEQAAVIRAVL